MRAKRYRRNITVIKKRDRKRDKIYEQYIITIPREVAEKLGKTIEILDLGNIIVIYPCREINGSVESDRIDE